MKTKIIYIAPNDKVFTYNISGEVTYKDKVIEFFDEHTGEIVTLPLDRCQIREVA